MQISVVSFDGDMTLWDFRKVMCHSLKHTLMELQRRVPTQRVLELTIDEMIVSRNQFAEEVKPILRTSDFRFRYLFLKPAWSLH